MLEEGARRVRPAPDRGLDNCPVSVPEAQRHRGTENFSIFADGCLPLETIEETLSLSYPCNPCPIASEFCLQHSKLVRDSAIRHPHHTDFAFLCASVPWDAQYKTKAHPLCLFGYSLQLTELRSPQFNRTLDLQKKETS